MPRYFLQIAYLGTRYAGWQRQPNALGVQQVVEETISTLYGQDVEVFASGRTDSGVHASCQIVHVDLPPGVTTDTLLYRMNRLLPEEISVMAHWEVYPNAHARHSATGRQYRYRIRYKKDPFQNQTSAWLWPSPDLKAMQKASDLLLGERSFRGFSKVVEVEPHYRCRVSEAKWSEVEGGIDFTIRANRFLRGMVRAVVGALWQIGRGNYSPDWMQKVLENESAVLNAPLAPACGLTLENIEYPPEVFIRQIRQ